MFHDYLLWQALFWGLEIQQRAKQTSSPLVERKRLATATRHHGQTSACSPQLRCTPCTTCPSSLCSSHPGPLSALPTKLFPTLHLFTCLSFCLERFPLSFSHGFSSFHSLPKCQRGLPHLCSIPLHYSSIPAALTYDPFLH